jgi:phosphatidylinositol alpha-1,6-mannosyltransferase
VSSRRVLAAPSFGETGGGIGQVSTLLCDTFELAWPGETRLQALVTRGDASATFAEKLRFGTALLRQQAFGQARWVLFSHVALAQVQQNVPSFLRAPYGVFLHGIESWRPWTPALASVVRSAGARLTNSEFTARRVAAANPGLGDIDVCPLALAELPADPGERSRSLDVLMVGRLDAAERYKGHDEMIGVWRQVVDAVPRARLMIVGDGTDRARLEALARANGAGDRIVFTGFVHRAQLNTLYDHAALFALPSRGEGFGLVYLEAMAHRLPCLGSTLDAAGEIIVDGETGVLVDPDDGAGVARRLVELLQDAPRRARYGAAGRARLIARFHVDQFHRSVTAALERAFESTARNAAAVATRG